MNFEPLGDRVVILPDQSVKETITKSAGGIDLLDLQEKDATTGTIVALGPGAVLTAIGDAFQGGKNVVKVVFSPWTGYALTIEGVQYKILSECEIMGILHAEEAVHVA